ncbi:chemotaxis protein MotD [Hoeflea halophila]|uniref:Chemotaxis protein MotD n=1 Tax=Hoeflea halophila TaxID=714899 RepID=A0A286IEU6_9HYPH|nr:flagellar hook-length control protein FliK [Hoeflea halophila]SOE18186.1 chemotaxis protein MotD [Hoeflea halophila]
MNALDMVLQRQVPARSAARAGDGMSGGGEGDGARPDAFSAALSNEKRGAAADRDKIQSGNQTSTGNEASDADEQVSVQYGQSDDILNLLAGLKSSASYSDEAELGAEGDQLELTSGLVGPDGAIDGDPVDGPAGAADGELAHTDALAGQTPVPGNEIAATRVASQANVDSAARKPGEQVTSGDAQASTAAASQLGNAKAAQPSAETKAVAATPSTQTLAAAAAGMAAQAASPQPRAATSPADMQKDPTALKEAMRALGLESEQALAKSDAVRKQARGDAMGNRGDADARRADELTGKKDGKVEVIESRRFMPVQNLSPNSQMLTRSLAELGNSAIAAERAAPAQAVAQSGGPQPGQTLHTLKLQLNPVSLGSVTAVLKLSGEDLSVEIKVQTAEAYRQIKEDNQSILKSLRGQGFGVEQITVQHVVSTERASGQPAQQGLPAGQQGAGANDAQFFGREGSGNNASQQQSGSRGGQSHEQGSHAGSGARRTDGVYL